MTRLRFWLTARTAMQSEIARLEGIALEYERVAQQAVADRNRFAARLREMGETI